VLRDTPQSVPATRAVLERIGYFENTMFGDFWDFTANMAAQRHGLHQRAPARAHRRHLHADRAVLPGAALLPVRRLAARGPTPLSTASPPSHRISEQSRDVLSRYLVSGSLQRRRPPSHVNCDTVLKHDAFEPTRMVQVRFNNEDRDTVQLSPDHTLQFYDAFLELAAQLRAPSRARSGFYMRPGWTVLFCNWRALHGRSSLSRHAQNVWHIPLIGVGARNNARHQRTKEMRSRTASAREADCKCVNFSI
jgi:trimethyllysine dioxygenase